MFGEISSNLTMRPCAAIANWRFRIVAERPRGKQKDPGARRSRSAAILKCQFAIAALDLPQAALENTQQGVITPPNFLQMVSKMPLEFKNLEISLN